MKQSDDIAGIKFTKRYACNYTFDTKEYLYPFHLMNLIPVPFGKRRYYPSTPKLKGRKP